jgi:hypothetical protein
MASLPPAAKSWITAFAGMTEKRAARGTIAKAVCITGPRKRRRLHKKAEIGIDQGGARAHVHIFVKLPVLPRVCEKCNKAAGTDITRRPRITRAATSIPNRRISPFRQPPENGCHGCQIFAAAGARPPWQAPRLSAASPHRYTASALAATTSAKPPHNAVGLLWPPPGRRPSTPRLATRVTTAVFNRFPGYSCMLALVAPLSSEKSSGTE